MGWKRPRFERISEHWKARKAQASQRHSWHRLFRPVTLLRHVRVERLAQNTARCGIWSAVQVFSTCQVIGRLIDSRTWGVMLECGAVFVKLEWHSLQTLILGSPWDKDKEDCMFLMVCPKSKSVITHMQKKMSWGLDPSLWGWEETYRCISLQQIFPKMWVFGHWVMDRPWNALVAGGEMWSLSLHGESHDSAVQVGQGLAYVPNHNQID